tara:strand:- start:867 stop:2315 length:1449 start_codon:yes stop_codon:yes gene_type:complete
MGMEMRLNLKMTQKLVMTPMLQQAIKLLPLAKLELAQLIRQEIIENPILEELLEEETEERQEEDPGHLQDESFEKVDDFHPNENESINNQTEEWETYIQNNIDQGLSAENYSNDSIERPSIEATYKKEPTLSDHLLWQLNLSLDSEKDKFIGSCIIGNIQNDGYLNISIEELSTFCKAESSDIQRVLNIIQTFEPSGVGARSLRECLMIQAKALPERDFLVETLIEKYLDRLDGRNPQKITSELKISPQILSEALERIREFLPKPGLSYSSEGIDYISPDLIVVKTEKGYEIHLSDGEVPNIRINPFYQNLMKTSKEGDTKNYLEDKYRSAMWLIKSIDQRRQTIYKVGKSIVKLQKEFLDHGLSYLKPMVLKEVADDIEMHESTVSRITTNKYIDTPQGLFELKFFFHSGIKSHIGDNMSSIRVKDMIKELIKKEDSTKPYTDDQMVEILSQKNAKIARRTVTKYRKELNIPAASKRKRLY